MCSILLPCGCVGVMQLVCSILLPSGYGRVMRLVSSILLPSGYVGAAYVLKIRNTGYSPSDKKAYISTEKP